MIGGSRGRVVRRAITRPSESRGLFPAVTAAERLSRIKSINGSGLLVPAALRQGRQGAGESSSYPQIAQIYVDSRGNKLHAICENLPNLWIAVFLDLSRGARAGRSCRGSG